MQDVNAYNTYCQNSKYKSVTVPPAPYIVETALCELVYLNAVDPDSGPPRCEHVIARQQPKMDGPRMEISPSPLLPCSNPPQSSPPCRRDREGWGV